VFSEAVAVHSSRSVAKKNTNGSQFFITMKQTSWLDGKHVVFGRVLTGQEFLKKVEALGSNMGKPSSDVTIVDSGELDVVM